jgi:hypothetical protein
MEDLRSDRENNLIWPPSMEYVGEAEVLHCHRQQFSTLIDKI